MYYGKENGLFNLTLIYDYHLVNFKFMKNNKYTQIEKKTLASD
jgi:hypothetical protein